MAQKIHYSLNCYCIYYGLRISLYDFKIKMNFKRTTVIIYINIAIHKMNDTLKQIREEQQKRYEKHIRMENIKEKYKDKIVLNKTNLAIERIGYFIRKYYLRPILNNIDDIGGIYRYRIDITEANYFKGNAQINKDTDTVLYSLGIDLRVYGLYPDMEIYVDQNEHTLYLTDEQKDKISIRWINVNPDTNSGVRFRQILDATKVMTELYMENNKLK